MACYSRITATKMTDSVRLGEALSSLGYDPIPGVNVVTAMKDGREVLRYFRNNQGEGFSTYATDRDQLNGIQRRYSELGVRAWAKRSGFNVALAENDGRKLTLINRRG